MCAHAFGFGTNPVEPEGDGQLPAPTSDNCLTLESTLTGSCLESSTVENVKTTGSAVTETEGIACMEAEITKDASNKPFVFENYSFTELYF
ncbi:hypothetical protein JCM14076_18150 [Methylosoma difficile]